MDLKQDPDEIGLHLVNKTDAVPLVSMIIKIEIKSEIFTEETSTSSSANNTERENYMPLVAMSPEIDRHHKYEIFTEEISTTSSINSAKQTVQYHSVSELSTICKKSEQCVMKKESIIRPYHRNNMLLLKFNSSIYRYAIKKMDIDSSWLFKNSVLKIMDISIKNKGLSRSSIDLSLTYSNVCKYVLDKIAPYINNILAVEDVLIISGMSISEIKYNCISNHSFFKKLMKLYNYLVINHNGIRFEINTYFFKNIIL